MKQVLGCLLFGLAFSASAESTDVEITTAHTSSGQTIAFLWYVTNPALAGTSTHSKISIDGYVVDTLGAFYVHASDDAATLRATQVPAMAHFRMTIPISEEGAKQAIKAIQENDAPAVTGTCSQGACDLLKRSGAIVVPPPFDSLPALTAAYILMAKSFGGRSDIRVEFHGKKNAQLLIPVSLPSEILFGPLLAATGYLEINIYKAIRVLNRFSRTLKKSCPELLENETKSPQGML